MNPITLNRNVENRPPPFFAPPQFNSSNNPNNKKTASFYSFNTAAVSASSSSPKRNGTIDQDDDPPPTPNHNNYLFTTPTGLTFATEGAAGDSCLNESPSKFQQQQHGELFGSEKDSNQTNTTTCCSSCGVSLHQYRHKILVLERELDWQKQNMKNLLDANERGKKDKMDLFSTLLHENQILKLGIGVNSYTADIERGKLISLVNQSSDRIDNEVRLQQLKEEIRKVNSHRHREQSSFNTMKRELNHKVGKLQDTLSALQKDSSEEITTLKSRLHKMRLGPQIQDLQRAATSARNLRASVNRLRASISDLIETGPLSRQNLQQLFVHVDETVENFFHRQTEKELGENNNDDQQQRPNSSTMMRSNVPSPFPGIGGSFASAASSNQQYFNNNTTFTPAASFLNSHNSPSLQQQQQAGGGGDQLTSMSSFVPPPQEPVYVMDTNLKDLCKSLINYWGGHEENALMQELASTLEERINAPLDEGEANESDHCRSSLYQTVSILTDALRGAFGQLEKVKNEKEILSRHLASFKSQLRQIRENARPPHQDAETNCEYEEFVPVFDDSSQLLPLHNNNSSNRNSKSGASSPNALAGLETSSIGYRSFRGGSLSRGNSSKSRKDSKSKQQQRTGSMFSSSSSRRGTTSTMMKQQRTKSEASLMSEPGASSSNRRRRNTKQEQQQQQKYSSSTKTTRKASSSANNNNDNRRSSSGMSQHSLASSRNNNGDDDDDFFGGTPSRKRYSNNKNPLGEESIGEESIASAFSYHSHYARDAVASSSSPPPKKRKNPLHDESSMAMSVNSTTSGATRRKTRGEGKGKEGRSESIFNIPARPALALGHQQHIRNQNKSHRRPVTATTTSSSTPRKRKQTTSTSASTSLATSARKSNTNPKQNQLQQQEESTRTLTPESRKYSIASLKSSEGVGGGRGGSLISPVERGIISSTSAENNNNNNNNDKTNHVEGIETTTSERASSPNSLVAEPQTSRTPIVPSGDSTMKKSTRSSSAKSTSTTKNNKKK